MEDTLNDLPDDDNESEDVSENGIDEEEHDTIADEATDDFLRLIRLVKSSATMPSKLKSKMEN